MHAIFQCRHPDICALQAHFEYLFHVCVSTPAHTEKFHLFVNQPDDIEVAKFVRQLQIIVEHFMHLHMINCFFVQLCFFGPHRFYLTAIGPTGLRAATVTLDLKSLCKSLHAQFFHEHHQLFPSQSILLILLQMTILLMWSLFLLMQ